MKLSPSLVRPASVAITALACVLLQLAFSLFYWLPTRSLAIAAKPSLDVLVLIPLVLAVATAHRRAATRWRLAYILRSVLLYTVPVVVLLSILLGIAQGVALREFGYHFTLAYHTSKVKALFLMMYDAQSGFLFASIMLLLAVAVSAVVTASAWSVRRVWKIADKGLSHALTLGGVVLLYGLILGFTIGINGSMSAKIISQLDESIHRDQRLREQASTIEKKMKTVRTIELGEDLRRPTVLVFVVESYGQILFDAEKYADFRSYLGGLQTGLADHDYHMRSTVFRAPVFGGSSWLANATILCRVIVPTEKTYFSLMEADTSCLPSQFNEAGYHSVFAASNTTEIDEEYARRFPFETFFSRDALGYKGPRMSWSYMPDQFVIDVVERKVLSQPSERPRFVYYKLTSSHHPWDTIPKYIKNWNRIGDGSIYSKQKTIRFPDNAFMGGKHYNEGYEASIRYSLETIVAYLNAMPADREVLALVLGDHQPRRPVAVMDEDPWTVPMHVISRDAELVDRFARQGYRPGLFAQQEAGLVPGLERLADQLFAALNDATFVETQAYE